MSEAIFGLVGVVIGALASGGVEYALRRRDERTQVRAVARILLHHLTTPAMRLRSAVDDRRWEDLALACTPMTAWREHELLVARFLAEEDDWDKVMLAFNAGEQVDVEVLRFASDDDRVSFAQGVYETLAEGAEVLRRFVR